MHRALIAIALLSCTAPPVTAQTPTPSVTATPLSSATASASPSRQFTDLTLAAAGDIRGAHALVLHVISSPTAGVPSQLRIWDVPSDGSAARQLVSYTRGPQVFTELDGLDLARQLSPDGRQLVLSDPVDISGAGLIVIDLISGSARKIAIGGGSGQPAWSPDGQRIAYRGFAIVGPFQKESGIWVVPASGGAPQQIATSDIAAGSGASTLHGWTSDGAGVVFSKGSAPANVVDAATGKVTPLGGVLQAINWRAKRPSVVLVFNDQEPTPRAALAGHVEVRDTILSASRTVARYGPGEGTFFAASSWNPSSDEILVTYACGQGVICHDELVIVDSAVGTMRVLRTATTPRSAAWSADGARIFYGDLTGLRVVNADGSNDHELFRPPGVAQQFVTAVTAFAPR